MRQRMRTTGRRKNAGENEEAKFIVQVVVLLLLSQKRALKRKNGILCNI